MLVQEKPENEREMKTPSKEVGSLFFFHPDSAWDPEEPSWSQCWVETFESVRVLLSVKVQESMLVQVQTGSVLVPPSGIRWSSGTKTALFPTWTFVLRTEADPEEDPGPGPYQWHDWESPSGPGPYVLHLGCGGADCSGFRSRWVVPLHTCTDRKIIKDHVSDDVDTEREERVRTWAVHRFDPRGGGDWTELVLTTINKDQSLLRRTSCWSGGPVAGPLIVWITGEDPTLNWILFNSVIKHNDLEPSPL